MCRRFDTARSRPFGWRGFRADFGHSARRGAKNARKQPLDVPLTDIGEFIAEPGLWQLDPSGDRRVLTPRGWSIRLRIAMTTFIYDAAAEPATAAFGAALAEVLPGGTTVALCGTLGAGKTRLVQTIAESLGIDRRSVVSPTFVLVQEHRGRRTIHHLDAYRLADEDEFLALGPEEFFESDGLVFVEWADRVEGCLPKDRVEIYIEVTGPESRRFEVVPIGERYATVVEPTAALV